MKIQPNSPQTKIPTETQHTLHTHLEEMGLELPFVDAFESQITQIQQTSQGTPTLWSTREFDQLPTPQALLDEVQSGKHDFYLIFGQLDTGGFNRSTLSLFMSNDNMTIIFLAPYNGAYSNNNSVAAKLRIFEKMNTAIATAKAEHKIEPNQKLVLFHTATPLPEKTQWAWISTHDDHAHNMTQDWHTSDRFPLLNAAASIPGYRP